MEKRIILVAVVLLLAGMTLWAGGSQEAQLEEEREEIAGIWDTYCDAFESGDAETFIALHEPGAFKMPPQAPMYLMKEAAPGMRKSLPEGARKMDIEMEIYWDEIIIHDDIAWSMGTYLIESTPKNGDPPSVMDGKFLTILRQQDDGSWKIYRDCYNSNVPQMAAVSSAE